MTPPLQLLRNAMVPLLSGHHAPLVAAVLTGVCTFVFALGLVALVAKHRDRASESAYVRARARRSVPPVQEITAAYHHAQPVVQWLPWAEPSPLVVTPPCNTAILPSPQTAQAAQAAAPAPAPVLAPAAPPPATELYFTPVVTSAVETGPMTPAFVVPLACIDFEDDPTLFGEPVFERNELDPTPARHATAPKIRKVDSANSSMIRLATWAA